MSASMSSDASAEPNMTPILDMVFQLITFFMMVINLKNASIDEKLKLPVIGSAQVLESTNVQDYLYLNVNEAGELIVYNRPREIESYIAEESRNALRIAQRDNPNFKAGDELPTTVVLRAEATVSYEKLDRIIKACQERRFTKFHFRGEGDKPKGAGRG